MPERLVILGAGGHGRAVAALAEECGFRVVGFIDREAGPARPEVLGRDADVRALFAAGRFEGAVVGVGNAVLARRAGLFRLLREAGIAAPPLVHPRAAVARSCRVSAGAVVFPGTVLGAGVEVGDNAVVYSGAVVEHDCRIGEHAYLSPGVILSGAVRVEAGAFLGSGAVVLPGLTIGEGAVVGAGAVVLASVRAGETVIGVPARLARGRA